MKVDRKGFLLALGLGTNAVGAAGCIIETPPPAKPTTVDNRAPAPAPTAEATYDPTGEAFCIGRDGWDPTSECVAWSEGTVLPGYAPTGECIDWAPVDEMNPTDECIGWLYEPSTEA